MYLLHATNSDCQYLLNVFGQIATFWEIIKKMCEGSSLQRSELATVLRYTYSSHLHFRHAFYHCILLKQFYPCQNGLEESGKSLWPQRGQGFLLDGLPPGVCRRHS